MAVVNDGLIEYKFRMMKLCIDNFTDIKIVIQKKR
jgi:hypothetical protein